MPKVNRTTDRAHVIMSFDLNQRDFEDFISEIKSSKFFPNLIGIEVKRPNYGNPVIGLGALLLRDINVSEDSSQEEELYECGIPQGESLSTDESKIPSTDDEITEEGGDENDK